MASANSEKKTEKKTVKKSSPRTGRKKGPDGYNLDAVVEKTGDGKITIAERRSLEKADKLKKMKLPLIVIAGIVVVVAVIVTVLVLLSGSDDHKPADKPSESLSEDQTKPSESEPTEPRDIEVGTDVLAHYSTDIAGTADRTNNLILACKAINGTVLDVDEEFSFNNVVGERTEEKGYRPASIYADGDVIDGVGGGICQVASTIYLVALKSDLEITERHTHQFPVSYLPLGMDASIYWNSQDLKFINNSGAPMRILADVSDNCVNITFEGTKKDDGYIRMSYEVMDTYDYEEIEKVDTTKEPGYRSEETSGITGYLVKTYYNYFDAEDNLIRKVECAWSDYNKRDRVIVVGSKGDDEAESTDSSEKPTEQPSEKPTEKPTEKPSGGSSNPTYATDPDELPTIPIDDEEFDFEDDDIPATEPRPSEAQPTNPTVDDSYWDDELPTVPPFEYDDD